MPETMPDAIPWKRYAMIRGALGACGTTTGLLLGFVFVTVWHWTAVVALWFFGARGGAWIYVWDALFLGVLIWEGYRYKQRMPPDPCADAARVVGMVTVGLPLRMGPQHTAFAVSEILYVAPRLFFWGWRQFRRVALPSRKQAEKAYEVLAFLVTGRGWTPFEEVHDEFRGRNEAVGALTLLVRVGLAEGCMRDGVLCFRPSRPEWI